MRTRGHSRRVQSYVLAAAACLVVLGTTAAAGSSSEEPEPDPDEVRFNLPPTDEAPNPLLASGVGVGADVALYVSSGLGPLALNPAAAENTPESYINAQQYPGGVLPEGVTITEAQGMNAMFRAHDELASQGLCLSDVISMRIYLAAPPGADRADYDGWNRAYRKWMANVDRATGEVIGDYAPVAYANEARPSRTNVEVASLPRVGWLVEVELVTAYPADAGPGTHGCDLESS